MADAATDSGVRFNKQNGWMAKEKDMTLETIAHWATVLTATIALIAAAVGVCYSMWIRSERRRIVNHYLKLLDESEERVQKAIDGIDTELGVDHVRAMSFLINLIEIRNTLLVDAYSNLMRAKAMDKLPTPRLQWPIVMEESTKP